MRQFNAYSLEDWPRMKSGEIIFQNTNEAIYYAHLVDDRLAANNLLNKWRIKNFQDIAFLKLKRPVNLNRLFDLAVRGQLYRECIEEIQRLNQGEK